MRRNDPSQKIAILGAGMLGSCLSLELARRNLEVDLYDREKACLTQAGMRNEGKIHLGFVYGADRTRKTADTMLEGAARFFPLLRRWLGKRIDSMPLSSPFCYAIAKDSILSVEECELYFRYLSEKLSSDSRFTHLFSPCRPIDPLDWKKTFDPTKIAAVFQTPERAVDARFLSSLLREEIERSSFIQFYPYSEIVGGRNLPSKIELSIARLPFSTIEKKQYDLVINTLWDGKLSLDSDFGTKETASWSYRLKHAIFFETQHPLSIPSTTLIQGPYGDFVDFGNNCYYVSWYPTCLQGFAVNVLKPPSWKRDLAVPEQEAMAKEAIANLKLWIPSLQSIRSFKNLSVLGGIIYARGETDVGDPKSALHDRSYLHIQRKGNYYSIDPGKFSLCPHFADLAAEEICAVSLPQAAL